MKFHLVPNTSKIYKATKSQICYILLLKRIKSSKTNEKRQLTYLSWKFSLELSFTKVGSIIESGCTLRGSSTLGELNINDDNNGSASVLGEETKHEEPPRRDCRFPSRNSFLSKENVEFGPPLRSLRLRWMWTYSQGRLDTLHHGLMRKPNQATKRHKEQKNY